MRHRNWPDFLKPTSFFLEQKRGNHHGLTNVFEIRRISIRRIFLWNSRNTLDFFTIRRIFDKSNIFSKTILRAAAAIFFVLILFSVTDFSQKRKIHSKEETHCSNALFKVIMKEQKMFKVHSETPNWICPSPGWRWHTPAFCAQSSKYAGIRRQAGVLWCTTPYTKSFFWTWTFNKPKIWTWTLTFCRPSGAAQ